MAHIEERNGRYRVQVRRKDAQSVSRTFDTLEDAQAWGLEVERSVRHGKMPAPLPIDHRIAMGEVAERYLLERYGADANTKAAALPIRRARARFGRAFLSTIVPSDIHKWRDELLADGLAPETVNRYLAALSSLFRYAQQALSIELPDGNPVKEVRAAPMPLQLTDAQREWEKASDSAALQASAYKVAIESRSQFIRHVRALHQLPPEAAAAWADTELEEVAHRLHTALDQEADAASRFRQAIERLHTVSAGKAFVRRRRLVAFAT